MVTSSYKRYLKSAAWQQKRQAAFNLYGKKCYVCKTRKPPIQVHHLTYARLGNENVRTDLRPLCWTCHREVTRLHWKLGRRKYTGQQVFEIFIKQRQTSARRS